MIDNITVGKTIAALRQQANLSQQGLADLCSVTHQAVSKWENGQALPDMQTLLFLSRYFHVSMEDILTGNVPGESQEIPVFDAENSENEISDEEKKAEKPSNGWAQIMELAPFASRGTIERLIKENLDSGESIDWQMFSALIPFCSKKLVDEWLDHGVMDKLPWQHAREMIFFASKSAVEKLVEKFMDEMDLQKLVEIAPFVSQSFLAKALSRVKDADADQVLRVLMPFLPQSTVDELILKKYGKTGKDTAE